MLLDITRIERKTYYQSLSELIKANKRNGYAGFWGQPDQETMDMFRENNYNFIDLDIPLYTYEKTSIPQTTCYIIQDVASNAYALKDKLDFLIATTGPDKCEQGRNIADILTNEGFPVINATNANYSPIRDSLLANAKIPLKFRIIRIMELTYKPLTMEEEAFYKANQIDKPAFIFHGVPPRDLSILDNFPVDTRVEGWTKLVELGIPGRIDLEWQISSDIPTVFFTQSFCHKELLASYWAKKIGGLHIEAHNAITNSTEAKLQAYLGLAGQIFTKE
ncbi:MAG: hypothetical protein ACOYVD_10915 [Bacillota bacterium]